MKKSRFIARAGSLQAKEDMKPLLKSMAIDYPNARHYCWAYLIGDPACALTAAMSDDGEPTGTAGKPILNVIQHKAVGDVFVIVARYFGGIKLGAGGLVRAYAGVTEQIMSSLVLERQIPKLICELRFPFAKEQQVRHLLSSVEAEISNVNYSEMVKFQVVIPEHEAKQLFSTFESYQIEYSVNP